MFTGIIEEIGVIRRIVKKGNSAQITVEAKKVLEDVRLGDSIATNGVCLTVNKFDDLSFQVDVMAETMRRTNLNYIKIGDYVNLERAMSIYGRFGGHFVSGHVDGVGIITNYQKEDNAIWITITPPKELLKYIVLKGSIAVDGISLTVAYVDEDVFKVSIIPHTQEKTTLINKKVGEYVNLECDIIAKYIEKLMFNRDDNLKNNNITLDFLSKHGFV